MSSFGGWIPKGELLGSLSCRHSGDEGGFPDSDAKQDRKTPNYEARVFLCAQYSNLRIQSVTSGWVVVHLADSLAVTEGFEQQNPTTS